MTHIPKLFCFCGGEMYNEKMGIVLEVVLENQDDCPYYKISSDLYHCKDCGTRVFVPAQQPIIKHYQEGFKRFNAEFIVRLGN